MSESDNHIVEEAIAAFMEAFPPADDGDEYSFLTTDQILEEVLLHVGVEYDKAKFVALLRAKGYSYAVVPGTTSFAWRVLSKG